MQMSVVPRCGAADSRAAAGAREPRGRAASRSPGLGPRSGGHGGGRGPEAPAAPLRARGARAGQRVRAAGWQRHCSLTSLAGRAAAAALQVAFVIRRSPADTAAARKTRSRSRAERQEGGRGAPRGQEPRAAAGLGPGGRQRDRNREREGRNRISLPSAGSEAVRGRCFACVS